MNPQALYLTDPQTLTFEANVLAVFSLPDGRTGVRLDRTYFYPTGGGQEHDTGTLGEARVVEAIKGDDGAVVHVVDRPVAPGPIAAQIDADRRLRHMQHHTAQHLLTGCFLELLDLDTLSSNVNGATPSTLDLPQASLAAADLDRVEDLAQQIIYEDRPVRSYFVPAEEIGRLNLRKAPSVTGEVRIVEIEHFDRVPCGGTHVASTGSIGSIKILKTERVRDRIRVSFVAGLQAKDVFRAYHRTVSELASRLGVPSGDLVEAVTRQVGQAEAAQTALQAVRAELLGYEAQRLTAEARQAGERQVVEAHFPDRPAAELRALAGELRRIPGTVAVLSSFEGNRLTVLVACAPGTDRSARDLLASVLAPYNARGGGDATLAQGGGPLPDPAIFLAHVHEVVDAI